jgi:hypothetical protein
MRKASILSSLFLLIAVAFYTVLPSGCANIIPPSGGPRDSTAPRLISATPRDSSINFNSKRITFVFDEYIGDPQDLQNNLLFTPTFEINPEIAIKAKTMTLTFRGKDTLQANTTYIFNFGDAIRDVNESNVLKNFVYTVSTGPVLDSLTLEGEVILAENGKTDSTLTVMLHRNLADSAVRQERPIYLARVDGEGRFRFQNLPNDTFAIYALGDAVSTMRRYSDTSKLFAFADNYVVPGTTKDITLYAYKARLSAPNFTTPLQVRNAPNTTDKRLRFTTVPASGPIDLQSDYVLNFATPLKNFDSSLLSLTRDTTFIATTYSVVLDSTRTSLRFRSTWQQGGTYNIILNKDFAEDSSGRKLLKTDTLNFSVKKLSDYATLNIRIRNLDVARNPVLLFLQNDQVVFSTNIKSGTYRSQLFNPGEYDLRILYDTNNNGKWDPGRFFGAKRQPELVQPVPRKLVIKLNVDNDFDVSL